MPTEPPDPAATAALFDLLGEETRLRIVRELYRHRREEPDEPGLSFSALGARVGVEDTGRFNYHLGRLRGSLVEKRAGRYVLTPLGAHLGAVALESAAPDPAGPSP
ncbi:DUF7347 domain-containing protein [Natrononativus amylolyticus]|uniref:DUF7347 domain-containing protein n=1 Tax=Natrononativus amylolyticus TaxID=2963434 RepID=UPI0020CC7FEC|nr:helix-turn-helix domain-containing protein [Natrononativus amylolyticus]